MPDVKGEDVVPSITSVLAKIEVTAQYYGVGLSRMERRVLAGWVQSLWGNEAVLEFGRDDYRQRREIVRALLENRPVMFRGRAL